MPDEQASLRLQDIKDTSEKLKKAQDFIATEVWGQDKIVKLTLACMVAGGHMLAVGVPGLAKTRLVSRVANVMGLNSKRIQFTPDLMPSDIIGSEVLGKDEQGEQALSFVPGPLFTQFLLADEINRAGPKTQSALLEAMQEKKVTFAGQTYKLDRPFIVMATQNPIEQEGVYPLPEAQLDRFLMKLDFDYPDQDTSKKIMVERTGPVEDYTELKRRAQAGEDLTKTEDKTDKSRIAPVFNRNDLILAQALVREMPLPQNVVDAATKIVHASRPTDPSSSELVRKYVAPMGGAGPRAMEAFALAAKAVALMDGRPAPSVQDILDVAGPVLEHRMSLNYSAAADGIKKSDIVHEIIKRIRP